MIHYRIRFVLLLSLVCAAHARAQSTNESGEIVALRNEIDQLKQNQQEMAKSLKVIQDILMGKRPNNVVIRVGDSPTMGDAAAKITIVEFSDFQCPYCGTYARETLGKILDQYVKNGKVRYVVRNFPMDQLHPLAGTAAEAAMCANEQGKYWEAHTLFFDNQQALDEVIQLKEGDATAVGINTASFERCMESKKYTETIRRDLRDGIALGVKGTPTFFLGYSDVKDPSQIRAVKSIVGAASLEQFVAAIEGLSEQDREVEGSAIK